jgi:hypothetical protein
MNSGSILLLVIGVFVIIDSCFGQRPSCEKLMKHFAADIIKVDSILSTSFHCNIQRTSNVPSRSLQFDKGNIRFELNRGNDWKEDAICPMIPEMDRPKKYN